MSEKGISERTSDIRKNLMRYGRITEIGANLWERHECGRSGRILRDWFEFDPLVHEAEPPSV